MDKSFEMIKRKEYITLYEFDQLYISRLNDGGLNEINEARINFPPTYKYISGSNNYLNDIENLRTPSWTDRILFCHKNNIRNLDYSNIPTIMYSDHRPVQASFEINLQPKNKMNNNDFNTGFHFQSNKNNNYNNPFLKDNYNNNNFGHNNFNMNNNNNNYTGFNNNFGNNNYNNNQMNMNRNFNNNLNGNMNNHRNNQSNIYKSQRNNFNFNNNGNNNNNFNQMNQNNNFDSNQYQQQGNGFDKSNISKTLIKPGNNNRQNSDNNKDDDNDTIDNIMRFFK